MRPNTQVALHLELKIRAAYWGINNSDGVVGKKAQKSLDDISSASFDALRDTFTHATYHATRDTRPCH